MIVLLAVLVSRTTVQCLALVSWHPTDMWHNTRSTCTTVTQDTIAGAYYWYSVVETVVTVLQYYLVISTSFTNY